MKSFIPLIVKHPLIPLLLIGAIWLISTHIDLAAQEQLEQQLCAKKWPDDPAYQRAKVRTCTNL